MTPLPLPHQGLTPIKFKGVQVDAGPVDIDIEAGFTQWIFPQDRRLELFAKMKLEQRTVEALLQSTGAGRDGLKGLEALATSVSTWRRYTGLQKVQGTVEMVAAELAANDYDKIVLFCLHRDVIEGLRVKLRKFKPVTFYGGSSPEAKTRNLSKFASNSQCRVFIGNIPAVQPPVSLVSAAQVVFVENDWLSRNNASALMRVHNRDQQRKVFVRFVGLRGSVDATVTQLVQRRTRETTDKFIIN